MNPALSPDLAAYVRRRDRIGVMIVLGAVAGILMCLFGCGSITHPAAESAPSTPQQIATAQTAVAAVKSDVAAAKKAAASVATAHQTLTTAKATVAALPTTATTQQAEAVSQIDGADADLVSADSALGITLDNADTHTDQATTALTGAQKSAQADQAREKKKDKELAETKEENKQLKAADPVKTWLEIAGFVSIMLGALIALCLWLSSFIPVVGPFLASRETLALEVAAGLFLFGVLLAWLARWLDTAEKVVGWSAVGLVVIILLILLRRYWSNISSFIVSGKTTPATPAPASVFPASGK